MALAILGVIVTLLVTTVRTVMSTIEVVETRSHVFHSTRLAFSIMMDELQSAVFSTGVDKPSFTGHAQRHAGRSLDRIAFDSYEFQQYPGVLPGTDPVTFDWWVADGYLLHRQIPTLFGKMKSTELPESAPYKEFESLWDIFPLAENVQDFRLRYHDGTQWVKEWSAQGSELLPRAVSIALTLQIPGGGDQQFSTLVGLPHGNQDLF